MEDFTQPVLRFRFHIKPCFLFCFIRENRRVLRITRLGLFVVTLGFVARGVVLVHAMNLHVEKRQGQQTQTDSKEETAEERVDEARNNDKTER